MITGESRLFIKVFRTSTEMTFPKIERFIMLDAPSPNTVSGSGVDKNKFDSRYKIDETSISLFPAFRFASFNKDFVKTIEDNQLESEFLVSRPNVTSSNPAICPSTSISILLLLMLLFSCAK